jgi:hypothetical protein
MVFVKRLLCLACVLTFVCVETSITTPASEQGHVANKLRTLAFLPPANISGKFSPTIQFIQCKRTALSCQTDSECCSRSCTQLEGKGHGQCD